MFVIKLNSFRNLDYEMWKEYETIQYRQLIKTHLSILIVLLAVTKNFFQS